MIQCSYLHISLRWSIPVNLMAFSTNLWTPWWSLPNLFGSKSPSLQRNRPSEIFSVLERQVRYNSSTISIACIGQWYESCNDMSPVMTQQLAIRMMLRVWHPPGQNSVGKSSKSCIQSANWEQPEMGIRAVLCDSKKPRPKAPPTSRQIQSLHPRSLISVAAQLLKPEYYRMWLVEMRMNANRPIDRANSL